MVTWQLTLAAVPQAVSAVLTAGLALLAFQYRDRPIGRWLFVVMTLTALWAAGDAITLLTVTERVGEIANTVRFTGAAVVSPAVLGLVLVYVNRGEWLTRRRLAGLFALPAVTLVLVWTNGIHHLIRRSVTVDPFAVPVSGRSIQYLAIEYGPWYYVHAGYSYLCLALAGYLLVDRIFDPRQIRTYRLQSAAIFLSYLFPLVLHLLFMGGIVRIDLTSFGFGVSGLLVFLSVSRYEILTVVPIARRNVVESMDSGVIVANTSDRIVDLNENAASVLARDRSALVGQHLDTVFESYPEVGELLTGQGRDSARVTLDQGGEQRHYELTVTPLDDGGTQLGRMLRFRDVSDEIHINRMLREKMAQLERQNERLEEFADLVSHDLRNPLTVIQGHATLAAEASDPTDHLDVISDNADRMEAIIDDVLTLAREGQSVTDPAPLSLAAVCRDAWESVDTGEASLQVETDRTVEADEGRLRRIFENLYRNALEHGDPDATLTVGDCQDGFFVADDGPGIPADERDQVLEKGYTTSDDGTGFGLSIVTSAAEAHGWSVAVTESESGGARFEITGLATVSEPAD